ncbi:MAG: carboxypeptidase-like regulatory domain-containing protein [Bacteroidetes bacterium]|nr:carboxypeptidase-like regulatory domain-containing protein [Bacteroidota bacterium]
MKIFIIVLKFCLCLLLVSISVNCNSVPDDDYISPTIISGQVKNPENQPLANAKVTIPTAPEYDGAFTNDLGLYCLENFQPGKHRIKVELYGYEIYEADVPNPINCIATINPVLKRKTYSVPPIKPLSKGPVRINGKKLEVDFDGDGFFEQYFVKGAAYSIMPIGNKPITSKLEDRSIQYLKNMSANTIRTYGGASKPMLQKMAANNIRVIVGFWVNTDYDLSKSTIRQKVKDDFMKMVIDLKDSPGVLMWNLGNEQNYQNGNNSYWYSLIQELAILAYNIEGEKYHPVCGSNGKFYNIGSPSMSADDASLTYMDLWASNIYEFDFSGSFASYRTKTKKTVVLTEWGIDALDNRAKIEYEDVQATHDSLNWTQILKASDICVGGTVFEFTDEWWKDKDPYSHDYGGYATSAHPDGYSNEEWWGVIAVTPDTNGDGLDEWRARKVYYTLQKLWGK